MRRRAAEVKTGWRTRLCLEPLEERIAPAGGVTVLLRGGSLFVHGDAEGNDVIIDQWGLAEDEFIVSSGPDDTLINGDWGPVLAQGVTGRIHAALGDGDDALSILDATTFAATVDCGRGSDFVELSDVEIESGLRITARGDSAVLLDGVSAGNLFIRGGTGFDEVFARDCCIWGNVNIVGRRGGSSTVLQDSLVLGRFSLRNGAGEDLLDLDGSALFGPVNIANAGGGSRTRVFNDNLVLGAFTLRNGRGADTVILDSSAFESRLRISNGHGDSVVQAGTCEIGVDSLTGRLSDMSVRAGGGLDELLIFDSTVGRHLNVNHGGGGSLTMLSGTVTGGNLAFRAGSGNDNVVVEFSHVGGLTNVNTGSGDDGLWVDDSQFAGRAVVNTGRGNDAIVLDTVTEAGYEAPTVFSGMTVLAGGAGDDQFFLGLYGTDGAYVRFEAPVVVSGGSGYDILDVIDNGDVFLASARDVGIEEVI
jgi:hypothetical protein